MPPYTVGHSAIHIIHGTYRHSGTKPHGHHLCKKHHRRTVPENHRERNRHKFLRKQEEYRHDA